MQEWTFMVTYPADFPWLWQRAGEVMGSPRPILIWVWTVLFMSALGLTAALALVRFGRRDADALAKKSRPEIPSAAVFGAVALVVGVAGYASFLNVLNYYTQPWYYITLAAFAASAMEAVFGAWSTERSFPVLPLTLKSGRLAVVFVLLAIAAGPSWAELRARHTNLDLVGRKLQMLTNEADLILVPRWECAITLCRYYHGTAAVLTLPPIDDHRFHRYDLVLRQMMTRDAIQPGLTRLEETLRSGHRVFLVGNLPFPEANVLIPTLPPLYRDGDGDWHGAPYNTVWAGQAGQLLRAHAISANKLSVPVPGEASVQDFEHLELGVLEGWR
jgi:hypothetical protein